MPTHPFVQQHQNYLLPSDTFIVSYPRSGNTWLRLLLADIIQQQAGLATQTILPIDADQLIPDLDRGYWPEPKLGIAMPCRLFKTHSVHHALIKNAIVIFRQPADSLCSYFHFQRRRNPSQIQLRAGIDAFCLRNVDDWCDHISSYLSPQRSNSVNALWISFEQLHVQPLFALRSAAVFLGIDTDDATLARAIDHQSFEKLRVIDPIESNHQQYFFRRGTINTARDELRSKTQQIIERKTSSLYVSAAERLSSSQLKSIA